MNGDGGVPWSHLLGLGRIHRGHKPLIKNKKQSAISVPAFLRLDVAHNKRKNKDTESNSYPTDWMLSKKQDLFKVFFEDLLPIPGSPSLRPARSGLLGAEVRITAEYSRPGF
jgi:hypothetical protein